MKLSIPVSILAVIGIFSLAAVSGTFLEKLTASETTKHDAAPHYYFRVLKVSLDTVDAEQEILKFNDFLRRTKPNDEIINYEMSPMAGDFGHTKKFLIVFQIKSGG